MESGKVVALSARTGPKRCAFCHDGLEDGWEARCACGSSLHLTCLREAGDACPTCGAAAPARPRPPAQNFAAVAAAGTDELLRSLAGSLERQGDITRESFVWLQRTLIVGFTCLAAALSALFGALRLPWP